VQLAFRTPPKVTLSITSTCNQDCSYCYADCNRGIEELSIGEWRRFIDYLIDHDVIELFIEGGEPLLLAGFDELLAHCARRLMTMVRTNGTLLDAARAAQWKSIGVGRAFVDVMGTTAATHDALAGVEGSFARATAGVRHLVTAGIPTDMLVILHRRSAPELQRYLELAASLGAERVGVLRLYPLGRAKRRWPELALPLDEQQRVLAALKPPAGLQLMQSWHPRDSNCCWQNAAVDAHGNSIGCPYLREYVNYGNIRSVDFFEGWHGDPLYRQLRSGRVEKSCPDCHQTERTHGGCRATAYAFHGRWTAPDPYCRTLNEGVRIDVLPERLLLATPVAAPQAGA
jgi:radical SAM protein with 4Fe4S-binding SPASM domain